MSASFDIAPWGSRQPKFEKLVCDGPGLYFLVYRLASGAEVRVQLSPTG